jgi:hypothetical protein
MTRYSSKFLNLLKEDEEPGENLGDDKAAFAAGLDRDTPADAFDDVPANPVAEYEAGQKANAVNVLSTWVSSVEEFIERLNGLNPDSMNAQLHRTDCGSIMSDVSRSESKKISRIAQDLSSLGESLKQYLLTAQNKQESQDNI